MGWFCKPLNSDYFYAAFKSGSKACFLEFPKGFPGSTILHRSPLCFGLFGALQGGGELVFGVADGVAEVVAFAELELVQVARWDVDGGFEVQVFVSEVVGVDAVEQDGLIAGVGDEGSPGLVAVPWGFDIEGFGHGVVGGVVGAGVDVEAVFDGFEGAPQADVFEILCVRNERPCGFLSVKDFLFLGALLALLSARITRVVAARNFPPSATGFRRLCPFRRMLMHNGRTQM